LFSLAFYRSGLDRHAFFMRIQPTVRCSQHDTRILLIPCTLFVSMRVMDLSHNGIAGRCVGAYFL
jgi:hypothetical protein